MDGLPVPGAFPSPPEDGPAINRTPKRRFIGRRTAEAQAKQRQDAQTNGAVEETTAIIPKSWFSHSSYQLLLTLSQHLDEHHEH
jgi:hypothetical protein